jgi:uncharacterized protein YtpQ (UPF0354 family)
MGIFDKFRDPLSKDEFGRTVADRMKHAGEPGSLSFDSKEFRIVIEDEDGEPVGIFNLDNVYAEYCRKPSDERDAFLSKVVQVGLVRHKEIPKDFADAKHDILPAIRSRAIFGLLWLNQKVQGEPVGPELPSFPVGDHLVALAVYDLPEATQTITEDQMDDWGVSFYEVMEVAKQNLANLEFTVGQAGDHLYAVMTGDSYDSSRLLQLDLVRQLKVKGEPIAMVPHRDVALITGSEDEEGLAMMAALAEQEFEHPRYLSCTTLRLEGDEWVSWSLPPDHPHIAKFRLLETKSLYAMYEQQKEMLDALHEKDGTDLYVAKYNAVEDKSGGIFSYSLWSDGVEALLPKSHRVLFFRDGQNIVASGEWDHVFQIVGHLMEETDLYPIRYRVREFPTDDELAAIGSVMG